MRRFVTLSALFLGMTVALGGCVVYPAGGGYYYGGYGGGWGYHQHFGGRW